jgi:hypothetical protein
MKNENQVTEFSLVADFVLKFQKEHPYIYISENITLEDIARWLAQPHWKMYSDNLALGIIDQKMYDRFMLGMFADWVLASGNCEVDE